MSPTTRLVKGTNVDTLKSRFRFIQKKQFRRVKKKELQNKITLTSKPPTDICVGHQRWIKNFEVEKYC